MEKGRGTGEIDYGVKAAISEEYYNHRLRFVENVGYTHKGDPTRNGVTILNLADEVGLSAGFSYALTRHIETVTELVGTVYVGSSTPDYNRVNPWDYQTGVRFHFMDGRISFGGAFRENLTRSDLHSNIPGLIFANNVNGGSFVPTVFNFASDGISSFVAYMSIGIRKPEVTTTPLPTPVNGPPVVSCSVSPDSVQKGTAILW